MQDQKNKTKKHSPLMDWLIRVLKGFLIGFGGIVPGLSGGVLSVILGVYDKMMAFLGNITYRFKENFIFFLPIGIGGVLGILFFAGVIEAAFGTYAALFTALFIGFVAGTLPSIFRKAGEQGRDNVDWLIAIVSAVFLFVLMLLGEQSFTAVTPSIPVWFLSGFIIALGFIIPGLSPSNFLIYFGLYDKMASGIKNFDFAMLVPFIIGAILCIFLFAKLANYLFEKFYSRMYHFIFGLVIGSTLAIFPTVIFPAFSTKNLIAMKLSFGMALLLSLLMFVVGIIISYLFSKLEDRYDTDG